MRFYNVYRSSSLWPGIKQFYSIILDYKWYSNTSLANIAGLSNGASIPDTVSQFWTNCDWNIPLSLQQMPHFFNHIMVRREHDIPNWILPETFNHIISLLNSL